LARRGLKVAIIGSGIMGEAHARAAVSEGAAIAAIADVDSERAVTLGRALHAPVLSSQEILVRADIDAVHICTPPAGHFQLCHDALSAGRNVLCEKPLAQSHNEVRALLDLADANHAIVCPAHQFPFQDGVSNVLRTRDKLGSVVHLRSEMCTAGAAGLPGAEMHQIALDILTHPLSLFRAFGVAPLAAIEWNVVAPQQGELLISGVFQNIGLTVVVSTHGRPTANSFRIIGTSATASIDLFHGFAIIEPGTVSRLSKATRPFVSSGRTVGAALTNGIRRALAAETAFPGLRRFVGAFYDAVEKKAPPPVSPDEIADIASSRDTIMTLASDRSPEQ
jgi:predicted dehydrogenase